MRCKKVAKSIKKEVSKIIQEELKDPRIGFITITDVEVTADLKYAKIFFSIWDKENISKVSSGLKSAHRYIRMLLARRLKLRFVPEIEFKLDTSIEYGIGIEKKIEEIRDESR